MRDRAFPRRPTQAPTGELNLALSPYLIPRELSHVLFAFWLFMIAFGILWSFATPQGYYFLFGSIACAIVTAPLALGPSPAISPWTLVVIAVYLGSGLRSPFVSLKIEGSRSLDELFLLGKGPQFFVEPAILYLAGLALLTLGYHSLTGARKRHGDASFWTDYRFRPSASLVFFASACVGFLAFYLYVRATGGFSVANLSAKRSLVAGGADVGRDYSSHGSLRALNLFGAVAFWGQIARYSSPEYRTVPGVWRGLYLFALFVNASLLPFYASTRQDVVFIAVIGVGVSLCLSSGRFSPKLLIWVSVVALAILPAMTYLRAVDQNRTSATNATWLELSLDTFVYSRSFSDIQVNAQIIDAVPEKLALAKGSTIAAWLAAPIPRSYWTDKPLISAGPVIGRAIFGTPRSGVPPGLIGESFWNFGLIGLLSIPFLFGLGLGYVQSRLTAGRTMTAAGALLYCGCGMRIGIDGVTNSIGYAIFNAAQSFVVIGIVLLLAGGTPSRLDGLRRGSRTRPAAHSPSRSQRRHPVGSRRP